MILNKIHLTYCHRKPERSFFWKGKQFPVCARCTGIHIGYLTFPIFLFGFVTLNFWITILMIIPTYLDGTIQAFFNRESNNFIRITTGIIAGIGSMSLISIIGKKIGDYILLLI
ncbi:DUF2085 domain-containing protein [Flavobacterium ponti]|jgi:uncharacterized membrane protein|uniref:DUF2085 domain-containing protein n=1 Tax=Flavobacterium ponti TaxID=665133 RepID=A0ABV9PA17_9FLAO